VVSVADGKGGGHIYTRMHFLKTAFAAGLCLVAPPAESLHTAGECRLVVLWYNAENLFHPSDDPSGADDEFTPAGIRGWTMYRYRKKLDRLAQVIVAAGGWEAPAVVGLCEIENGTVLEDLVAHPLLLPFQYSYLHRDGPDHRGMDVACLFRPELFGAAGWEWFAPPRSPGLDSTREVLHLWGSRGKDTLDMFFIHFISRYRGAAATAAYRTVQAEWLLHLADSVRCTRPGTPLLLAGDFNDSPEGYSLKPFLERLPCGDAVFQAGPCGNTYKYRGTWSNLDRFLVVGKYPGIRLNCRVLSLPSLLTEDRTYGGSKPFRTYEGYTYAGGFSDHLPVVLQVDRAVPAPGLLP